MTKSQANTLQWGENLTWHLSGKTVTFIAWHPNPTDDKTILVATEDGSVFAVPPSQVSQVALEIKAVEIFNTVGNLSFEVEGVEIGISSEVHARWIAEVQVTLRPPEVME